MECLLRTEAGCSALLEHAAGRLLGRRAYAVASHIGECPQCASFVGQQTELLDLMDVWQPAPVSMTFNRELYGRIQQSSGVSWFAALEPIFNWLVARPALPLAALSLLVVAGLYVDRPKIPASATASLAQAPPAVSPTDAEQLGKALDDLQLLHQLDLVKDEAADASRGM